MKIIISPAKKMNVKTDILPYKSMPVFLEDTERLLQWVQALSFLEVQKLWGCNEKLARLNFDRLKDMRLDRNPTPALLSYEGIQYRYMAPEVFTEKECKYVQSHLRILSGFYGVLKPFDGVVPYRLEMQAKAKVNGTKDLYDFWKGKIYEEVAADKTMVTIINLASKEYSGCIEKYLDPQDTYITCVFGELRGDKIIQKGTLAKMARGEMVRFMAENSIREPEGIKEFNRLGYHFEKELSSEKEFIFLKD
ncbi:MAG: peroxide stress protein YaaA [Lachnospiraceae bacterium]